MTEPLNHEQKVKVLLELWKNEMTWTPLAEANHHADKISMVLPDSIIKKSNATLDTLINGFVAVYLNFVLANERRHFDSLYAAFYSLHDKVNMAYWAICYIPQYSKDKWPPEALAAALMYFSPFRKNLFKIDDELVMLFKYNGKWTPPLLDAVQIYTKTVAGIVGKYFLQNDKRVNRIMILWEDRVGGTVPMTFFPHSKEFKETFKYL